MAGDSRAVVIVQQYPILIVVRKSLRSRKSVVVEQGAREIAFTVATKAGSSPRPNPVAAGHSCEHSNGLQSFDIALFVTFR